MLNEKHSLLDGKVHVYRIPNSRYGQCSSYMSGSNYRVSTKEENLKLALEFAREWYTAVYVETKRVSRGNRIDELVTRYTGTESTTSIPLNAPSPFQIRKETVPKAKPKGESFAKAADKFIA